MSENIAKLAIVVGSKGVDKTTKEMEALKKEVTLLTKQMQGLKKGTKTSLQYHVKKIESNYLYRGKAKLHYMKKNIQLIKKNFSKILEATTSNTIKQGYVINVRPKTIHRLEAISNLVLFEVSSPHLSDVVRVSDDSNRPDGKIKDEHKKKFA